MPDPLIPLHRPTPPIWFPADVARLRAALEAEGYTASDVDLQWAWQQFSRVEWGEEWCSPEREENENLASVLLIYLELKETVDVPA